MKQYKMIAIDLDGTLLDAAGNVSDRSKQAVRMALDAGLLVCFATGRNWTESKPVLDAVAHYDCAVFVGGAMIVDTKNEVVLHRMLMDPALAREVSRFLEARGQCVLAMQDTSVAGFDYVVSGDIPMEASTQFWMEFSGSAVHTVPRMADYDHSNTVRVGFVALPPVAESVSRELDSLFGQRIVWHNIHAVKQGVSVVEVFDPAVNKWQGILHVAARHGVTRDEIIAIGDDMNDLPMLREAGLGVAMGNGRPEAKAVAKRVIGSNRDDGLAVFLEELVSHHIVQPLVDMSDTNKEQPGA
jgi:Cof subfamily protein (haloacid dehalogenase superfamily)